MEKIRIYCDSGADISKLRKLSPKLDFYQFPYDSPDRPKKPLLLAMPSAARWDDCHAAWEEFTEITWDDFTESPLHHQIEAIIGSVNRKDVLHFDSAHKTQCEVFLTSDKGDIWSKRDALESATGIKTFCTPLETEEALTHVKKMLSLKSPIQ